MTTTTTQQQLSPTAGAAAIAVAGVAAEYKHGRVLSDITFDVRAGETFGLVGLNGAGKTTLIKIILGLMEASEGAVTVFGGVAGALETKKKIAYLPEKFEPPAFLSCQEFVKFSLDLYKRAYDPADVVAAATRLDLPVDVLDRRVNTYSKGMRQKVGLMGSWLTDCPLLILDEPMSGLDPRARVKVKDEILRCRDKGMTVFLSSHILADMDEMCDRVAVLHDGFLRFTGTPADLRGQTGQSSLERAFLDIIDRPAGT